MFFYSLNKRTLLHYLNRISWFYAYVGLLYALYFIYFIVIPAYNKQYYQSNIVFHIVFLYFFFQGYFNLILTTFSSSSSSSLSNEEIDRYCCQCLKYARERSYHCRLCQYCVPRQDHHCFFVGTCIGEHNQRYFILMLAHLLCAHILGYWFVCEYLWSEVGGFSILTIIKIIFF